MRIIRVVCTPDGICRESGDIIEKDFTPDECVVLTAEPKEHYVTHGAGGVREDTVAGGVTADVRAVNAGGSTVVGGAAADGDAVSGSTVVPGNGAAENDERKVQGRRIAGRLETGAGTEYAFPVQEACVMTPKKITRYAIEGKARVAVKKTVDGERTVVENAREIPVGEAWEGKLTFSIGEKEHILGLGQHEDGVANYRGCRQYLYQNNMQIPMPVFLSTAGWAILLDADCLMIYEERDNRITVTLDAVEQVAYYVIQGDTMAELVAGIRKITGKAAMLPKWAYGYIQSRERYCSQEEIREVAEEFGKRKIPVSCLVQDWQYWGEGKWGDKHPDKVRYPDLKALTNTLHDRGISLMVSVWPNMNKGGQDNQEMMEAGKLYANLSTYDAFDEEARELYWKQCESEFFSGGTDAWWCDSTEPFTPDWNGAQKRIDRERYQISAAELTRYMDARKANVYALYHAKGIHDNQRKAAPETRVVNLTRSGYLSSQKYGTILWSGDIAATWDVLKRQIVEGLQMAASGIPYWNLDIGAFFVGNLESWKRWSGAKEGTQPWFWHGDFEEGVKDKGYCELYVRWLQYGTFLPVMRSHGTDTPREPWQFGEEGGLYYDTIVRYIRLRYYLLPYFYSLAYQVWREDAMTMRSLLFDYREEEKAAEAEDEFLFGDFLVCPVTFPMEYGPGSVPLSEEKKRPVYLPAGDGWYDYETKEYLVGGREISAAAPVERMPLYVKAGSILPVDSRETADLYHEQQGEEVELEIYAGKDGSFTCYLDSGNGYGYQQGEYAAVGLQWKEESRELTLGAAEGEYAYPVRWKYTLYTETGSSSGELAYAGQELTAKL